MDSKAIYQELIEIAEKMGYEVKESRMSEEISSSGGKIKIKEKRYVLLNTGAKIDDRIASLVKVLQIENLNRLHISPFIRDKYFKNE
jgi:polyribonucleotide nucleotidyltransferase